MRTTIPMLSVEDEALLRLLLQRADVAQIAGALDVSDVEAAVLRASLLTRLQRLPIDLLTEIVGRLLPPDNGAAPAGRAEQIEQVEQDAKPSELTAA